MPHYHYPPAHCCLNPPVWPQKLQPNKQESPNEPHLPLPICSSSHRACSDAPLQHHPSPSPRGMQKPGGKGTLTELTLEPIGLPNLVDSDHWGAANFLEDIGQDLLFFCPETMQGKKRKKKSKLLL